MSNETVQTESLWITLFKVIAIAVGCITFGLWIKGQFSDPASTGIGNYLMSIGTMILLAIGIAAAIIIGIAYLIYWLFYKPRCEDPYQY